MAPKSAAALFLLAAMIAGLAPPLQAQLDPRFVFSFVSQVDEVCSGDDAMRSCAIELVSSGDATILPDCCRALQMKAVTSAEGKRCACGFGNVAATLGVDVDQSCQAASNGDVAGGPSSKLSELCR
ncbi:hypothetical protein SEVIR_8G233900v4 [Setaria viridis]|uniref:Bifunctional inhibitor/plant lipid transfer protein/seed storage helical domain-containing protein n=1 Tax=Setaria viridis TaxID=4556 RepID=A0A4U6TIP6_SETVI|nr:hypothetical protein SEVIR_8G233900v2 [Setaria viridis]